MIDLDDYSTYQASDPHGMIGFIRDLPKQCRDAWIFGKSVALPKEYCGINKIVILGSGGSAISGDILRALAALESQIPVFSHGGYHLPPYVDDNTLVVASSYSGQTEEVLSAFTEAIPLHAKKLAITTGGRLLRLSTECGIPTVQFDYRSEPRAALGYSLMLLLAMAQKIDMLDDLDAKVDEACSVLGSLDKRLGLQVATGDNYAKQLARRLYGRLPIIYGAGILSPVALRWKTQFNENSKVWSFHEELPQANHNAIAGYCLPRAMVQSAFVVLIRSSSMHERILLRYRLTEQALSEAGIEYDTLAVEPVGPLAQILAGIAYGDYVSYYLAILNQTDPTPTPAIQSIKDALTFSQ